MTSNQHLGNLALQAAVYSDTITKQADRINLAKTVGQKGLELFNKGVGKAKAAPEQAWSAAKAAPGQAWSATKAAPGMAARGAWSATKAAPGALGRGLWSMGKGLIPNTPGKALAYPGFAAAYEYAPEVWDSITAPGRRMAQADTAMELINKMSELTAGQRFGYALDPESARYRMLAQLAQEYPQALDYYHNSGQLSTQEIQRILNQL